MLPLRAAAALLCLAAAAPATVATSWTPDRFAQWPSSAGPERDPFPPRSQVVRALGLTVRLERKHCGDGRPVSEACGDSYVNAVVTAPGGGTVTVEGAAGLRWFLGVGRLGADLRPAVMLVTDMGGSGGCVTIDVARPEGVGYRAGRLRSTLCRVDADKLAWPRDLTGHGRADLLVGDDRFDCRFASCAASWTPPRVLAVEDLQLRDVSDDPALASLYRADMRRARAACERVREEAAAPCAAFAADAARLGEFAQARAFVERQVRRGCRVGERPCYADAEFPTNYMADLTAFLHDGRYQRATPR